MSSLSSAESASLPPRVFAPALQALKDGRIGALKLVLSHRTEQIELTTTRMSQRYFWRRPSPEHLLP